MKQLAYSKAPPRNVKRGDSWSWHCASQRRVISGVVIRVVRDERGVPVWMCAAEK